MDSKSDFPKLLRDYRKENGLTQRSLAAKLGLSYNSVIDYENGRSIPSPKSREVIAQKTGIDISRIPQGKRGAKTVFSPLTEQEQLFAEQQHDIVVKYLLYNKLLFDQWYDGVIFRYLQAVKSWFSRPDLHKYTFSTIAQHNMRSAVMNEMRKESRKPVTVSIYDYIPGTEFTYEGRLCDPRDNVNTDFELLQSNAKRNRRVKQ